MDNKAKILDIAMNLTRIGNWAADDYDGKKKRIEMFLQQTSEYIKSINNADFEEPFLSTYNSFLDAYRSLSDQNSVDRFVWAERMMTWGNILTHRSKFL